jgi:hypothetical protein
VKCKKNGKWSTYVNLGKNRKKFGKQFDDKLKAARYADKLCAEHGLERKNFDVDGKRIPEMMKKTSKFHQQRCAKLLQTRRKILKDKKKSIDCKNELQSAEKADEPCPQFGFQLNKFPSKNEIETEQSNLETYNLNNEKETSIPISKINNLPQNEEKENLLKRKRDLAKAVTEDNINIVKTLYADGWIDPNFDILSPIFNVKSWEIAQFLVNQDARTRDIVNADGETPLDAARRKGAGYEGAVEFFEQDFELERASKM